MSRHDRCPALSGFRWLAHASLGEAQSALALDLGVCIDAALADRGRAVLALAGGRTPLALYRALALQSRDWTRVHVVPTDERWVGRGHPARNEDELVAAFAAADGIRVHGLLGREAAPAPSAQTACEVLQEFEGPFDAVLLGMGQDAHTASLFPHALGLDAAWRSDADAACVVVNLFMLPDEPELFRQCVENISRVRASCHTYGMPLMIEPLVMLPNEVRGGYQVDGNAEKIVTLVRLASEMGADIIKADPTENPEDFHRVVEAARVPVLVRGGGRDDLKAVLMKSAALMAQGAKGMVYGRNIYQHDNPKAVVNALMGMIHRGASGEEAWDIYNRG